MTDNNKRDEEQAKQEVTLEDLPPEESKTEQVKGGAGKSDLVNSIAD